MADRGGVSGDSGKWGLRRRPLGCGAPKFDKIEKGADRRIILGAAHGLDTEPATRLNAVAKLVTLAQLGLLAHTRRHGRLIPIRELREILCEDCHGSLQKEWGSFLLELGNAFALTRQDNPHDLLPSGDGYIIRAPRRYKVQLNSNNLP